MSKLHFVLSLPNRNSYQREQAKAATEAAVSVGADLQTLQADNDSVTQSDQVLKAIQSSAVRPSAILLEPLTSTGLVRAAEAAVAAGIGWVVLNSDVDYLDRLRATGAAPVFCVTRDHVEIGRIQGRQLNALLPDGGTVLYIQGPPNNTAATQRTLGMESTRHANIQVKALRSNWEEDGAYQAVSAWLRLSTNRESKVKAIACQYDGIAKGARRAFEELSESAERERWLSLPFTGVDGLPNEGRRWVDQGILAATVVSLATTDAAVRLLARAISNGQQPPLRTVIDLESYPPLEKLAQLGKRSGTITHPKFAAVHNS